MSLRETMRALHGEDRFAAEFSEPLTGGGNWASRPSRMPGRRGPVPKWTESVGASVTPDVARNILKAASRRKISKSALVRQILEAWLKANPEAWR